MNCVKSIHYYKIWEIDWILFSIHDINFFLFVEKFRKSWSRLSHFKSRSIYKFLLRWTKISRFFCWHRDKVPGMALLRLVAWNRHICLHPNCRIFIKDKQHIHIFKICLPLLHFRVQMRQVGCRKKPTVEQYMCDFFCFFLIITIITCHYYRYWWTTSNISLPKWHTIFASRIRLRLVVQCAMWTITTFVWD